ncbi:MAG: TraX family protein [Bacilli bacterium]
MRLDSFKLKITACILMTLSHIQYHIGINNILYIGQGAFPIFAYLCAYATTKTRNISLYVKRLLIFGAIIQIPIFIIGETYINIFITLGLGVFTINTIKNFNYTVIPIVLLFAYFTNLDYGIFGILLITIPYITKFNKHIFTLSLVILQLLWINVFNVFYVYQWLSLISIPFIYLYDYTKGYGKFKYFFYIYYPLHIVIIYGISLII